MLILLRFGWIGAKNDFQRLRFCVTMLVKFGAVNALQWCGKGGLEQGLGTSFASQVATCPPTTCPSTNNKKIRHKPSKIVMGTMGPGC